MLSVWFHLYVFSAAFTYIFVNVCSLLQYVINCVTATILNSFYCIVNVTAVYNKYLKVGLYNSGSLRRNHDDLIVAVMQHSIDILAVNETW